MYKNGTAVVTMHVTTISKQLPPHSWNCCKPLLWCMHHCNHTTCFQIWLLTGSFVGGTATVYRARYFAVISAFQWMFFTNDLLNKIRDGVFTPTGPSRFNLFPYWQIFVGFQKFIYYINDRHTTGKTQTRALWMKIAWRMPVSVSAGVYCALRCD